MAYFARMRLAKLGFTSPLEDLDSLTAEAMLVIDAEFNEFQSDEMNRKMKQRPATKRG